VWKFSYYNESKCPSIPDTAMQMLIMTCLDLSCRQYLNGGICTSQARIDDKVVVITGANTGIGIETAKDLVRRGKYEIIFPEK